MSIEDAEKSLGKGDFRVKHWRKERIRKVVKTYCNIYVGLQPKDEVIPFQNR